MKKMHRLTLFTLTLLLSLTGILTGCGSGIFKFDPEITLEVDVNIDQSVDLKLEMLVRKVELDFLDKTEEAIGDIAESLENEGFFIEKIAEGEKLGIRAKKTIDNSGGAYAASLNFDDLIEEEDFVLVTDYKIDQSFNLKDTLLEYGLVEESVILDEVLSQSDIKFIVKLPINPAEHNATEVKDSGKTLIWNIDPIEDNLVQLRVTVPNVKGIIVFGAIAIIGFVVLVLVFKKIFISIKNRK